MKTFSLLQPEVRRAMARKELRRRGLLADDDLEIRRAIEAATDEDLARMEELCAPFDRLPKEAWPAEVREEAERILARMLRAVAAVTADVITPAKTEAQLEAQAAEWERENAERQARWQAGASV